MIKWLPCQNSRPLVHNGMSTPAPWFRVHRRLTQDNSKLKYEQLPLMINFLFQLGWRPKDLTKSCHSFPTTALAGVANDFHPMDCNDIVLGTARGNLHRIEDYYTRDRYSTHVKYFWSLFQCEPCPVLEAHKRV